MTHLVDTSVWHEYGRNDRVQRVVDGLVSAVGLITTCPVIVAEYCFSARNPQELVDLQADMALLYTLESSSLVTGVKEIQEALWSTGRTRAAGAADTLIAAYCLDHDQTIVTCDVNFLRIAQSMAVAEAPRLLRVLHISHDGAVFSVP